MKKNIELFLIFLKIGVISFGGGYAMISIIKEIMVDKRKWMDEEEIVKIIAIAESTPGPIAINMATYVGFQRNKFLGSLFSTIGVVLPSLTIIFIISLYFKSLLDYQIVNDAMLGIKCAVALLIIKAGVEMFMKLERSWFMYLIFLFTFIVMVSIEVFSLGLSSIVLILIGGILGIFKNNLGIIKKGEIKK